MAPPNKKIRYNKKSSKKQFLCVGQRGFLATCNFREKDCVRECYNLLNEYADALYGPQQAEEKPADSAAFNEHEQTVSSDSDVESEEANDCDDIADELQREIEASKKSNDKTKKSTVKPRFQVADTGVLNCVFIKTTLQDPIELITHLMKDIAEKKQQKSRFLLRLLPVATVCRANMSDITNAAGQLFDKYFLKESHTFAVICNKRYNNDIDRMQICRELAQLIHDKNLKNKVNLKQPERAVIVEIIKGLCCLAVVENYFQYKKYNLVELANNKNCQPPNADETKSVAIAETSSAADVNETNSEITNNSADITEQKNNVE